MRALIGLFLAMTLVAGLAAAVADKKVSDDEIYDRVRLKLASDPDVKGGALEVAVSQGVVTIRGKVDKEKARQKAEKLAKKVSGVKQVVNQLRIEKPGTPGTK